jgi:hypothetical protein
MKTRNNKILYKEYLIKQIYLFWNYLKKYIQPKLHVNSKHLVFENKESYYENNLSLNIVDENCEKEDYLTANDKNGQLKWRHPTTKDEEIEKGNTNLVNTNALYEYSGTDNLIKTGDVVKGNWCVGDVNIKNDKITFNEAYIQMSTGTRNDEDDTRRMEVNGTQGSKVYFNIPVKFNEDIYSEGDYEINGNLTVNSNAEIKNDLTVDRNAIINKQLTVEGGTIVDTLIVNSTAEIKSDLTVNSNTEIKNDLTVNKNLQVLEGNITQTEGEKDKFSTEIFEIDASKNIIFTDICQLTKDNGIFYKDINFKKNINISNISLNNNKIAFGGNIIEVEKWIV